ncbi:MAG: hypothetical protein ACYCQK_01775 [Acidiferrobacteraceae bacterium]
MTDDGELRIRHIRLCDCGLPAGHESVCKPGRLAAAAKADREWLGTLAHRAARKHADTEAAERERFVTWMRSLDALALCEAALAPVVASTVPAGSLEPSRGGGERVGPPRQQLRSDDPRLRLALRQLCRAAEQILWLRREDQGHGTAGAAVTMLGEHKDIEILKCVGAKPREVVGLLGAQIAGGARTVERVREEAGRCRWCGQDWPDGAPRSRAEDS